MSRTIAVLVALGFAVVPASARASTYEVKLCADPTAIGFSERNDNGSMFVASAHCPPPEGDPYGGLYVGVRPGTGAAAVGSTASWTIAPPAGTSLRSLKARYRFAQSDPNYEVTVVDAAGDLRDGCRLGDTCLEEVTTRTYGAPGAMTFRVRCGAASCGSWVQGSTSWLRIEEATATIEDPAPPVLTGTSAGWQREPGVTFRAEDASGVRAIGLQGSSPRDQACDYRRLRSCPGTVTERLAAELPDGVHTLRAVATDAAGQSTTSEPVTLRLDRQAPAAPEGLTIRSSGTGYVYTWRNPDQRGAAPIAAAHLSDGTVVRGAGIERLEAATADALVYLEDEAGNADPGTAVGLNSTTTIPTQRPILQPTSAPRIRLTSVRREGTRLIVRGTVTNATAAKVSAIISRGKRQIRKAAAIRHGRFTVQIKLSPSLRRKGTITLTVRQGTAKASKRVRV